MFRMGACPGAGFRLNPGPVEPLDPAPVATALVTTSAVMLAVGLIACVEPARRALRIDPTDALKKDDDAARCA